MNNFLEQLKSALEICNKPRKFLVKIELPVSVFENISKKDYSEISYEDRITAIPVEVNVKIKKPKYKWKVLK